MKPFGIMLYQIIIISQMSMHSNGQSVDRLKCYHCAAIVILVCFKIICHSHTTKLAQLCYKEIILSTAHSCHVALLL